MIKYTLVIPYAYRPYFEQCMGTIKLPDENILTIDNTQSNKGVAESWNLGIDKLKTDNADWLIVMSAAIRFGESGGLDIIEQLEKHLDAHVVHFARKEVPEQNFIRGTGPSYDEGNLGWHLTAIRRDVIDKVGYFDPNFYPSYFEDIDYDLRVNKVYNVFNPDTLSYDNPLHWLILPVDAHGTTMSHAVRLGGIKTPVNALIAYFATKWGRHPNAAKLGEYEHPFDNPNNSVAFFPPAHGRNWND